MINKNLKILITGGSGLVGQNLTNRLLVLFIDSGPILINFCLQSLILIFWK